MKKFDSGNLTKDVFLFWQRHLPLVLFLVFFLLRLPSLFEPFTYGDEGIYLTLGQASRQGLVFYRDIHDNKPPLIYLIAALAGNFRNYRLISFFLSEIGFWLFYFLAKLVWPNKPKAILIALLSFSILATIPLFEGQIANAENFLIYFSIAGFLLLLIAKKSAWFYFLAGLFFSLSMLFKVPAILDFLAVLIIFFWLENNFKKIFEPLIQLRFWLFLAGFLIPLVISFVYYFSQGAGYDYLKAAFFQNLPYLSSWGSDKPKAFSLPLALFWRSLTLLFLILLLFFQRRSKETRNLNLIVVWFATSIFASLLSSRPYPHYLLQAVPALCLSIGFLFESKKGLRLIPLFFVWLIVVIFNRFDYYRYPIWPYYRNFYGYVLGQKGKADYLSFWGNQTENLYSTARFLKTHTTIKERIFIWGDQPCLYALSERLPIGRYASVYHIKDFDLNYQETLAALEKNLPRFWVVFKNDRDSLRQLYPLLEGNYSLIKEIGEAKIYFRQPAADNI